MCFFFSSRRRHTRLQGDWSSDVCSSDLLHVVIYPVDASVAPQMHRRGISRRAVLLGLAGLVAVSGGINWLALSQIGRASCRERGEISVGAGSLKKKKKRNIGASWTDDKP